MIKGHKIEKKLKVNAFLNIIRNIEEKNVIFTKHSDFRLKEFQRKIFKDRVIREFIKGQNPFLVGIQYNGCYAVFYNYPKNKSLKIILDIKGNKCEIVTFYIVNKNNIPKI